MKPVVYKEDALFQDGHPPLVLRLRPVVEIFPDQLLELSSLNKDLRLELTAEGGLVVMPPTGWETGNRNFEATGQLWAWTKHNGTGVASDSSGGFILPNGAVRSPDASWVERSRLEALSAEQRRKFLPLCPDFVLEIRSPTDRLGIQDKMREYLENGAKLGWLVDPQQRRVYVYRPEAPVRRQLENPETISGDPVLPGFVLDLREIW